MVSGAGGGATMADTPAWSSVAGQLQNESPETRTQAKVYSSYTWANLYVRCTTWATPNSVVNSRIGSANGNQTVTLTGTGVFQDTVNTDSLVDQNLINIQHDQVGGAPGSKVYTLWGSTLQDTGTNTTIALSTSGRIVLIDFGVTRFTTVHGQLNASAGLATTEADVQYRIRRATTYSNLRVFLSDNSINGDSSWRLRIDTGGGAANGNQVVTLTASTTGAFEDTTNSDPVAASDEINYSLVTGGTSGTMAFTLAQMKHISTGREMAAAIPVGVSQTSDVYYVAESGGAAPSTESDTQIAARAAFTAKNLVVNIVTNSITAGSDYYLRRNGANSALTLNVPASSTGLFEDTTNNVSVAVTDTYNFFFDHPAGVQSITATIIGMEQGPDDAISGGGNGYPSQIHNRRHHGRGHGRPGGRGQGLRVP